MTDHVLISGVGPRDGLQNARGRMSTAQKCAWIDALRAAVVREIEVGSFVPPKLLPQLADIADIVAHSLTRPGLTVAVLVPNLKGGLRALESGAHKITVPVSVSAAHSRANVNMTPDEAVAQVAALCRARDAMPDEPLYGHVTATGCAA